MRGKEVCQPLAFEVRGITPAYAGKSGEDCQPLPCTGDHPRVCGEKLDLLPQLAISVGSPPRMRGKGALSLYFSKVMRITPAYAGKSRGGGCSTTQCRDHPRICGEKEMELPYHENAWGSPPHMRGKVFEVHTESLTNRITPAYAGKSCPAS